MCMHSHTHTHTTVQSLHCGRNEGLGTFHAGHGERTSVALLAWLSKSNVVTPSTSPLRLCFSSVAPSVPSPFCESPCGLVASHGKHCALSLSYPGYYPCIKRGGISPQKKLSGDLLCAMVEVKIKKHVHYVLIWLSAKLPLFPSLAGAQNGNPPWI